MNMKNSLNICYFRRFCEHANPLDSRHLHTGPSRTGKVRKCHSGKNTSYQRRSCELPSVSFPTMTRLTRLKSGVPPPIQVKNEEFSGETHKSYFERLKCAINCGDFLSHRYIDLFGISFPIYLLFSSHLNQ